MHLQVWWLLRLPLQQIIKTTFDKYLIKQGNLFSITILAWFSISFCTVVITHLITLTEQVVTVTSSNDTMTTHSSTNVNLLRIVPDLSSSGIKWWLTGSLDPMCIRLNFSLNKTCEQWALKIWTCYIAILIWPAWAGVGTRHSLSFIFIILDCLPIPLGAVFITSLTSLRFLMNVCATEERKLTFQQTNNINLLWKVGVHFSRTIRIRFYTYNSSIISPILPAGLEEDTNC